MWSKSRVSNSYNLQQRVLSFPVDASRIGCRNRLLGFMARPDGKGMWLHPQAHTYAHKENLHTMVYFWAMIGMRFDVIILGLCKDITSCGRSCFWFVVVRDEQLQWARCARNWERAMLVFRIRKYKKPDSEPCVVPLTAFNTHRKWLFRTYRIPYTTTDRRMLSTNQVRICRSVIGARTMGCKRNTMFDHKAVSLRLDTTSHCIDVYGRGRLRQPTSIDWHMDSGQLHVMQHALICRLIDVYAGMCCAFHSIRIS